MGKLTTMILLYLIGIAIIILAVFFCLTDEPTTTRQDWSNEMRMKRLIETPPVN